MTRSWRKRGTDEDFYDTSKKGNIIEYMLSGIEDGSWTEEKDENCLFSDMGMIKKEEDENKLLSDILKAGRGFKAGGVFTIRGEDGYRYLRTLEGGSLIMRLITETVSSYSGINEKDIHYVSAIHKNTLDRHMHFLVYSDKEGKGPVSFKKMSEDIKSKACEIKEENLYSPEDKKIYEMKRTAFLSGTMDLARNLSKSGIKIKDIDSLPLIFREEIRAYAEDLIKLTPENAETDRKIREEIKKSILLGIKDKETVSEYFSGGFYKAGEEKVFMLIKSTAVSILKTVSGDCLKEYRKEISKYHVKKHARDAEKIIKEINEMYSEKLGVLAFKLARMNEEEVTEEQKPHMGNVSLL